MRGSLIIVPSFLPHNLKRFEKKHEKTSLYFVVNNYIDLRECGRFKTI